MTGHPRIPPKPRDWSERPRGTLVWVHIDRGTRAAALTDTLDRLMSHRGGLSLLVTLDEPDDPGALHLPATSLVMELDAPSRATIRQLADHFRPDAVLWTGQPLPVRMPGTPQFLADAALPAPRFWEMRRSVAAALKEMRAILTDPGPEADRLRRLGHPVETIGWLRPGTIALPCDPQRREAMAGTVATRPAWVAVDVPEAELAAVTAAHAKASRLAHRLLLILLPADTVDCAALARRLEAESWRAEFQSSGALPQEDTQIYVADGASELGLWYRLAPVAFFGGTLTAPGAGRPPFEAAALGAVVIHGPNTRAHAEQYDRLYHGGASCRVGAGAELAKEVERMLAPDRAAEMACAGWDVVSAGATVSDRVLELLDEALDAAEDA